MKHKTSDQIKTPDDYVASHPEAFHLTLEALRTIVERTAPEAEGLMRYGVIYYKYLYALVGIGSTKKEVSFYVMNPGLVETLDPAQVKFKGSTIYFPLDEPLPEPLIEQLVRTRM
ncbi:MAG: DUF1801 domain-containing protein, partial [Bacteroidota bacterium]